MQARELKLAIKAAVKKLIDSEIEPEISRPAGQFGDYATNIALQLAKKSAQTPKQVAEALVQELKDAPGVADATVAGPGFINFKLSEQALAAGASSATDLPKTSHGQQILAEFGDPNPFKEMHIGHLYSYIIGDAISSLLEADGADVKRLSYHGDVGLHVAKTVWAIKKFIQTASQDEVNSSKKPLGEFYADGAKAFEHDTNAKAEILDINEHIYARDDQQINGIYDKGKQLSFESFDKILDLLSITNDKRYLESDSARKGTEAVKQNIGRIFKESEGAIVYEGEKVGLHTRVFINSRGLPTYEAKDLGLAQLKAQDYPNAARSIVITAHEQAEYFKVMLAALSEIDKDTAAKTSHMSHGFLSLSSGKMSSREGNVYPAMKLLMEVKEAVHKQYPDSPVKKEMTLAAIKYSFLKHRLGSDIVFDVEESVNLEGNSGPYLQYAHARVSSILSKSIFQGSTLERGEFDENERNLARKVGEYPEVIEKAVTELMPHHVCTYLYELAQTFNSFYESSRIIGDEREQLRLSLARAYQQVLGHGLGILNIAAPERM